MSLQYVVHDYWDFGYCEGDAILEFGSASVSAQATVTSDGIRIKTSNGSINVVTICAATGQIIGEEWSDLVPDATSWTAVTESSNTWTTQSSGSNTWTRQ